MNLAAQRSFRFVSIVVLESHVACVSKSNVVELVKYRNKYKSNLYWEPTHVHLMQCACELYHLAYKVS
jgi:hypothetical protein